MDIIIGLRKTEDWENLDEHQYLRAFHQKFSQVPRQERDQFESNVVAWNKQLSQSYFGYRAELKKIANKSLLATQLPIMPIREAHEKADVVIPIDDDDILHPNLGQAVEQSFQGQIIIWNTPRYNITFAKERFVPHESRKCLVASNGYAVQAKTHFGDHSRITSYDFKIDQILALSIKHPACFLHNKTHKFRFNPQPIMRTDVPQNLTWAIRYINAVYELTKALHLSTQ